jgi:hypothetical protein
LAARPGTLRTVLGVVRDAALLVLLGAALALGFNRLRPTGALALVAEKPYEILVPCPEKLGRAAAIRPEDVRPREEGVLLVDAREAEEFARWHLGGALSVPFDYLEPVPEARVRELLRSRPRKVVVYGDGDRPDSGEQLARQLAGLGVRNVLYASGGAPALRRVEAGRRGGRP